MEIQRLRNLTTGLLHTQMSHIYEDIEYLVGEKGIMTHQLPNAFRALEPYLREKVTIPKLWEEVYDPDHTGDIEVQAMSEPERAEFWKRYGAIPSSLGFKRDIANDQHHTR
jgi:hypothetical protein